MLGRWQWSIMTVGGLGSVPRAPGTVGSLPPIAVAIVLSWNGTAPWIITVTMLSIAIIATILCVALAPWAIDHFKRNDPGEVVIDEVAGQSLALCFLPWVMGPEGGVRNMVIAAAAFLFFRILDIAKPGLIGRSQSLRAGWGIVMDDLLAGVGACLAGVLLWTIVGG